MVAYGCRRLTGRAMPEPELTWRQKWKTNYILSGCRRVRLPQGYFRPVASHLAVIDDFQNLSPLIWNQHDSTRLPLPKTVTGRASRLGPWHPPEASFLLKVDDGFVAPDGLVFDNRSAYRNGRWFYQPPPEGLTVERYDRLLTLVQLWGHRFIHFSFDTLPRIDIAFDFLRTDKDVCILVPDAGFYKTIFESFGIDPGRLVFSRPDRLYAAKTVYYPHFYSAGRPHQMGLLPQDAFQHLRCFLAPKEGEKDDLIVYLKRQPPATRTVANETELLTSIERRLKPGYRLKVYAPVNNWRQDRTVMHKARVVFGPHGGAWCNIVFCRPGTDVVEFLPLIRLRDAGKNERPCYYGLACGLGLQYWTIDPDNFYFDRPAAMEVPVQEVLTVFEKIGIVE